MAVESLNFNTQIDDWVKQTEQRITAVFRQASQEVASVASNGPPDGVPIDTGFARASIRASLSEMPSIDPSSRPVKGQNYPFDIGQVSLTINNAKLSDTIYIGWTAAYVIYLEYGHSKQAPSGFVRLAAEQWPAIVSQATIEAKARV